MKLSTKTTILQEMVSKAIKGCSNNKLLPLTSLMAIDFDTNVLTLITSDATNYLYVTTDKVAGDKFYVVIPAEQFSKLIARTTSEAVELEVFDSKLRIKGNGTYTIELPLDEEGRPIKFPNPMANITFTSDKQDIHLSTVKTILGTAKTSLSTSLDIPCYTGYYSGDKVIATDTYKICGINIKLFDKPILLSPEFVDLMDVMSDENIEVQIEGDTIVVGNGPVTIYGKALSGIEDYAVDAIDGLLGQNFKSMCKMPKDAILAVLDRLSLFVGTYDKNGIYLTFTKEGLMINSKKSSGTETIPFSESSNFSDFTCCIDITMLQAQIKAQASPVVEMWYGEDNAIKMVDGNITQIIALAEDDR